MNSVRRIAVLAAMGVVAVIVVLVGLLTARSDSEVQKNVERNFEVSSYSISYAETAFPQNTTVSADREQRMPETQLLSCKVEMSDPSFVLGISPAPVIEELVDDEGRSIDIDLTLPDSFHRRYKPPRFHPQFMPAQKPSRWERALRSILRLAPKRRWRSRRIDKLQPSWLYFNLSMATNGWPGGRIGRIKGYFYALTAESFDYVDLPFNKSDTWVRLTPDVEVQVREASYDNSLFRLSTEARWRGGAPVGPLSPESHIADRLVLDLQPVGPDNRPARPRNGGYSLPSRVDILLPRGSMRQMSKIRYVIAVNPTHHKIPFVLENISLPKP